MDIGSHIVVVGAGAIGSYFGAMLRKAGRNVTLIGRPAHVDAIRRGSLHLDGAGIDERIPIAASTDIAAVASADLVLFCVKSNDTETAARQMAPHLAPNAIVLSMQNGVDNIERMQRHIDNPVLPALIYVAANIPEPGYVRCSAAGHLVVGQSREAQLRQPNQPPLEQIAALFDAAGVPTKISAHIETELWTKLVLNCAYNAICALCDAPYGRMVATAEIRAVMREAVLEVAQVAKAKAIALPDTIVDMTFALADAMPQTRSSTAQDIARGRPTEIDHLNGYVAREGERLGIATPINRTLHALIKLLEQSKLVSNPPSASGAA